MLVCFWVTTAVIDPKSAVEACGVEKEIPIT